MKKKTLALILALVMALGLLAGCGGNNDTPSTPDTPATTDDTPATTPDTPADEPAPADDTTTDLPRTETLYFGGQQWGEVTSWNPVGANQNNAMAIASSASGSRTVMFETLYMYNFLTGEMIPLLADGDFSWNADKTELTVKINPAAKWNDGTAVTANDVKRTFDVGVEIDQPGTYHPYISEIVVNSDTELVLKANLDNLNPFMLEDFLSGQYVAQAAWIDTCLARNNGDKQGFLNDKAEDVAFSGPYGPYYSDNQKVVFIRNDNYWGQDASMWGKLPVPKYIAHTIYADNAASEVAFKAGEIDVNQQFMPNIQDLWEKDGLPISTYYDHAPYGMCATMPTAWFNMNMPVIAENVELRKAIAIAVDYDQIIANAMTNQSPSFAEVPRSVMNPTAGEQALYDHAAVADLQWVGNDIDGANALLDSAGIVDTDGDGWREWNGEKVTLQVSCPEGWSDWNAALEIVAAAGAKIGIDMSTNFPDADTYYATSLTNPNQTETAIFMWSPPAAAPSSPWARVNALMGKDYVGMENNWSGNFGQYVNDEADALIKAIPLMTDEAEIKAAYTELTRIYLTDVPSFSLMYRPDKFHAVNESVWTNFPNESNGIPPLDCTDGYSIASLYELELA
ncbi:MAG: ABC transporter substrate-binding protein [Oscillibacter sp.]|nr:ABC transporter substrate-binding protein [Oscillibacter sp.]